MPTTDVSLPSDRHRFNAAVHSRSWEWLLALQRRLTVDLQIVDDAQRPLLQPTESPIAVSLEPILAAGAPGLRQALSAAVRTRSSQAQSVEGTLLVMFPLTMGRAVDGVLIVAKRVPPGAPPERARGELELIGQWLSNAVEEHLVSPLAAEVDLTRLRSLCRLLGSRVSGNVGEESDRHIVSVFAETLAVWHDLEVYGYVETAAGDFVREVSLIGVDPSGSPARISRAALPETGEPTLLAPADIERLGFPVSHDVVITRLANAAGSWLLVVCGQIASYELTRISLYLGLLDQTITRAIETAKAHVTVAIARHLFDGDQRPEEQAGKALAEIQKTLRMSYVALDLTARGSQPVVHLGAVPSDAGGLSEGRHLVIVRKAPDDYTMTMTVGWAAERHVTRQEHEVAEASAELLDAWAQRVTRRARPAGERRTAARSFDQTLDQFARQALESGAPVTAVVLSFGDAVSRPGATQVRIGRIREQVRAADLVGRLTEGEIGMLLYDAPGTHAGAVVARVRRMLQTVGEPASPVSIGVASRSPGEAMAARVAQEARDAALRPADAS
jgi:hypothetical protein